MGPIDRSSWSRRPRRPSSRACSRICCRRSRRTPASRCAWSRWARARRSTSAGGAMPTWCSCTTAPPRRNSWRKARASSGCPVMYNDFVLVGPAADPAKVAGGKDILEALRKIAAAKAPFVSRADRSGTHAAELRYWKTAGIDIDAVKGPWYRETGSGMGPALNTASGMDAYILADRGTWLSFKNRGDAQDRGRGRQAPLQPVRRDAGQSGEASERQGGPRPEVRRLARVAARTGRDRGLQDRRRAAVLPNAGSDS